MPEWLEDLPDGTSRVRGDSGAEHVIPTQTAVNLGYHPSVQQQMPADMGLPTADVQQQMPATNLTFDPSIAHQAPAVGGGIDFPRVTSPVSTAPAPTLRGAKAREPGGPDRGLAGNILDATVAIQDAVGLGRDEPQQQPSSQPVQGPSQGAVDPSTLITNQAAAQRAPQGPQYATATTSRTQTTTTSTPGAEEDLALLGEATKRAQDANERVAEAKAQAATSIAAERDVAIEAHEKAAAQVQRRSQELEAYTDERMAKLGEFQQEFQQAAEDGKRSYWADKSTGAKVAAAIGIMFGAYKSGAYGGPNAGLEIINKAMADDRQRKRDRMDDLKSAIKGQYDLLTAARATTGDEIERDLLVRDTQLAAVQQRIEKAADIRGTEEARAIADQANAQLDMERAKVQSQLRDRVQTTKQTTSKRVPIGGAGGPGAQGLPTAGVNVVNPELWQSLKPQEQAKGRAALAAYYDTVEITNQMEQLRKEYGTEALATEAAERYKSLQNQLIAAQAVLMGSGVLNEGEAERYKKASGGDLSPHWSDAQRVFTLGGIDPTLNAVRGFRETVKSKASRVLPMQYGIGLQQGPSSFRAGVQ